MKTIVKKIKEIDCETRLKIIVCIVFGYAIVSLIIDLFANGAKIQ